MFNFTFVSKSILYDYHRRNTFSAFARNIKRLTARVRFFRLQPITNEKPPVWFVFSGMGSQWLGMGKQLLNIPVFARAIEKCDAVLRTKGIDIMDIMTSLDSRLFDNILNSFVGISAIQVRLPVRISARYAVVGHH